MMTLRKFFLLYLLLFIGIMASPLFADDPPISVLDGTTYTIPDATTIYNPSTTGTAILVSRGKAEGEALTINSEGRGIRVYLYQNYLPPVTDGIVDLGKTIINTKGVAVEADSYNYAYNAEVHLGNGSVINSTAAAVLAHRNGLVKIGDGATITGATFGSSSAVVMASASGRVEIGDNAVIVQTGDNGANNIAVLANNAPSSSYANPGYIKIGDESTIYSNGAGQGSSAVVAGYASPVSPFQVLYSGNIEIGRSADISTVGAQSYAVYSRHVDSSITIGEFSRIATSGNSSSAVRAGISTSSANTGGGIITLGDNVGIITTGNSSHGIDSAYAGSLISVGQGAEITTSGSGSHAVYAYYGGEISMNGAKIRVDSSRNSLAVTAQGQNTSSIASVTGSGIYDISGDIAARNYSNIDFIFDDGSRFTGHTELGSRGSILNLEISGSNSIWNVTGNSSLSKLTLNNSTVDFTTSALGTTVTAGSLNAGSAGGNFVIKTDITAGIGDKLIVSGTSAGSHSIEVSDAGSAPAAGTETLTIVETADGIADFSLAYGYAYFGAWEYGLRKVTGTAGDWELYGTGRAAPVASAAVNTFSAAYLMAYAETQTLIRRLGDLRDAPYLSGVWFRLHGGKFESNSGSFVKSFDMDYWGVQLGYDRKIDVKAEGDLYAGIMFGWSRGDLDYLSDGSGKVDSRTLGAYGTYIMPNGFFVDLVLKYQWMDNDFQTLDSSSGPVFGDDITTGGFGASLEIGRRLRLGGDRAGKTGWYAEPQAQISWQRQDGGYFLTTNGLHIGVDSFTSLLGRLGVLVGCETERANFYAKISRVKEFDGDVDIYANGIRTGESFGEDWWVYGIGFTSRVNERNSMYLDIERTSGGAFTQAWAVTAGWRIIF